MGSSAARRTVVACAAAALLAPSVASAADPGKRVARKSASGEMAALRLEATVASPKALYIRLGGTIGFGEVRLTCKRGFTKAAKGYMYRKAGLFRVPLKPAHPASCVVSLSVGGSGHATGEIRVVR